MSGPTSHPDNGGCPETGLSKALEALVPLFLLTIILVIYWQVTGHGFIDYRDGAAVVNNPHMRGGITAKGAAFSFKAVWEGGWRPLAWLSHMLDWALYGPYPGWHHLSSVFFHSINTLLLFLALKKMTGAVWPSAFVAAVFAVHPANVETVAWIAERKGLVSGLFCLLTLWSYARYAERPGSGRYVLCLFFFVLGLMAGSLVTTLPLALLLFDYWPLGRFQSLSGNHARAAGESKTTTLRPLWEKLPLVALAAVYVVVALFLAHQRAGGPSVHALPQGIPLTRIPLFYAAGLGNILWPGSLAAAYPSLDAFPAWTAVGSALLAAAISIAAVWLLRRRPYVAVGWFWYLAALTPALAFPDWDAWPAMADRFTYVPLIGVAVTVAWGFAHALQGVKHGRVVLSVGAGAVLSILIGLAWSQASLWRNSMTLFAHAVEVSPDNAIGRSNLGFALFSQGKHAEAIQQLTEAIRLRPDYAQAHAHLGLALNEQARFQEAIAHFSEALRIDPRYADAHAFWALALTRNGLLQEAKRHYMEALRIDPGHAEAHNNLGVVLYGEGRLEDAVHHYSEALRIRPDYGDAQRNLDNLLKLMAAPPRAPRIGRPPP